MEERRSNPIPTVAVALLLLVGIPLLYVGAYYALVVPTDGSGFSGGGSITISTVANYRFVGRSGRGVFEPVHNLDRRLRPQTWASREMEYHFLDEVE